MSKLDEIRALREATLKSSRGDRKQPQEAPRSPAAHGQVAKASATDAAVASGLRGTKTGRPRLENRGKTLKALKPWIALGMSERTWFRRQAEQRAKEKQ